MSHYYDQAPISASKERLISFEVCGTKISLYTDNGVFSKSRVDEGSLLLLQNVIPLHLSGRILDLGAGYGTLGLSIAVTSENARVDLADVNTRALSLCEKNAKLLKVDQRVTCLQSDIYSNIEGPYDSIVVNPPIRAGKKVTYQMYEGAKQHLSDGGSLYLVIRKAQGAESASKYIKELFGNIALLDRKKGYLIYQARKETN